MEKHLIKKIDTLLTALEAARYDAHVKVRQEHATLNEYTMLIIVHPLDEEDAKQLLRNPISAKLTIHG